MTGERDNTTPSQVRPPRPPCTTPSTASPPRPSRTTPSTVSPPRPPRTAPSTVPPSSQVRPTRPPCTTPSTASPPRPPRTAPSTVPPPLAPRPQQHAPPQQPLPSPSRGPINSLLNATHCQTHGRRVGQQLQAATTFHPLQQEGQQSTPVLPNENEPQSRNHVPREENQVPLQMDENQRRATFRAGVMFPYPGSNIDIEENRDEEGQENRRNVPRQVFQINYGNREIRILQTQMNDFQVNQLENARTLHLVHKLVYLYVTVLLLAFWFCVYFVLVHNFVISILESPSASSVLSLPFLLPFSFAWSNCLGIMWNMGLELTNNQMSYIKTSRGASWLTKAMYWLRIKLGLRCEGQLRHSDPKEVEDAVSILLFSIPFLAFAILLLCTCNVLSAFVQTQVISIVIAGSFAFVYMIEVFCEKRRIARVLFPREESCFGRITEIVTIKVHYARSVLTIAEEEEEEIDTMCGMDKCLFSQFPRGQRRRILLLNDLMQTWRRQVTRAEDGWRNHPLLVVNKGLALFAVVLIGIFIFKELGISNLLTVVGAIFIIRKIILCCDSPKCVQKRVLWDYIWPYDVEKSLNLRHTRQQSVVGPPNRSRGKAYVHIEFELKAFWAWAIGVLSCILCSILPLVFFLLREQWFGWLLLFLVVHLLCVFFWFLDEEAWIHWKGESLLRESTLLTSFQGTRNHEPTNRERHWYLLFKNNRLHKHIFRYAVLVPLLYGFALWRLSVDLQYGVPSSEMLKVTQRKPNTNVSAAYDGSNSHRMSYEGCNIPDLFQFRVPMDFDLADYALLSALAYHDNQVSTTVADQYFAERAFNISVVPEDFPKNHVHMTTFQIGSTNGNNFTILSIRGTSPDWRDIAEDIGVWTPVVVMQWFTWLLPFGDTWDGAIPYLLRLLKPFQFEDTYFLQVEKRVRELIQNGTKVVLTGHSLGGGIAMAVGARQQIPAICFSAPNHILNHAALDLSSSNLVEVNTFNVIPEGDLVPRVDKQVFHTQKIECRVLENITFPIECHSIKRTHCELFNKCSLAKGLQATPIHEMQFCHDLGY